MRGARALWPAIIIALGALLAGCDDFAALAPTRTPVREPITVTPLSPTAGAIGDEIPRCAPPYPQPPFTADSVRCGDPTGMQRAVVTHIVDGDTLDVLVDGREERVRLYGVDTTERGERCFRDATDRLEQLAGTEVLLSPDARDRDRYGRLLRYVYRPDGLSIDAQLIAEGLGTAWRDDGRLRFALIALEDRARTAQQGCIWNP